MTELYDGRLEVIDPDAGVVLASFRWDGPNQELPPFVGLIAGTARGYREVEDGLGFRSLEIYDIYLTSGAEN